MGVIDQKLFTDAVSQAKAAGPSLVSSEWVAAFHACNRLAMFDMLPALEAINLTDRGWLIALGSQKNLGQGAVNRFIFAKEVIDSREIEDLGLPEEQVNDGREFLGCTRLDDSGVQQIINHALTTAGVGVAREPCCGGVHTAWAPILVNQRRVPGASLIANLAAAAHYMLARYHVCAAKAAAWQMKAVIDGYDEKKRILIATGDRDLKKIALTGNRPFPPDFAIRAWAYKGADDGETDRLKCNSKTVRSVFPDVNGQEL